LIVDFDAVSAAELFELHAVRHDGWTGRIIGLGSVSAELVISLEIEQVFTAPFVRDSLRTEQRDKAVVLGRFRVTSKDGVTLSYTLDRWD
jgi:hypothetical protein